MRDICSRCKGKLSKGTCPHCFVPPPPPPSLQWLAKIQAPPLPVQGADGTPPLPAQESGGTPPLPPLAGQQAPRPQQTLPVLAKASIFRRFPAFIVDGALIAGPLLSLWQLGSIDGPAGYVAVAWAGFYWLFRDSFGASIGKLLLGLRVVRAVDGRRSGMGRSLVRNLVPLLLVIVTRHPLLSTLALLAEPLLVLVNRRGQRLGDMLAATRVVKK